VNLVSASGAVTPFTEKVGVPIAVALIALAATVGAAAFAFALGRWADTRAKRRDGYSSATRELVTWAEYPYRIRRRTSDDPTTLDALTEAGHQHQEALRFRATWIRTENRWVARVFDEVRKELGGVLAAACADAWRSQPIAAAEDMILGTWGPAGVDSHIARFERAVSFRFGWRRFAALFGWHPGA
jgi:hypothetical protein